MKKILLSLTILCSAIAVLAVGVSVTSNIMRSQRAGPATEGFQISATPEKESVASESAVRVRVKIKNITKNSLDLAEAGPEKSYEVIVHDDNGKTVQLTEHGRALQNTAGDFMNVGLRIKPGQEREDILEISSLYQMAAPGNYSIMVKRKVYSLDGKGVKQAESNAVHVRVLKKV